MRSSTRVLREIRRQLRAEGILGHAVEMSKSGHYHVRNPAGALVLVVPGSPGDRRWVAHLRSDLRRLLRQSERPDYLRYTAN